MNSVIFKIDNRETKLIELFKKSLPKEGSLSIDNDIIYNNLEYGDFIFEIDNQPLLIIERKSIADLVSSVKDTRYHNQKINLLNKFDRKNVYYIIEGLNDFNSNNKYFDERISKDLVLSCILNTMIRDDIKIFQTKNIEDTYNLLNNIWDRLRKNVNKYIEPSIPELQIKKCSNITKDNCFMYQLSQIPGLSLKSAKAVTEIYPNMSLFYSELLSKTIDEKRELLSKINTIDNKNNKRKLSIKAINNLIDYML
jgi:ERCC4-type nuclease